MQPTTNPSRQPDFFLAARVAAARFACGAARGDADLFQQLIAMQLR
jgi:hypothetical protein